MTKWQTVDCTCGNQLRLPFTIDTAQDQPVDSELRVDVRYVAFDDHLNWHVRRFHGGKDDQPLEAAA